MLDDKDLKGDETLISRQAQLCLSVIENESQWILSIYKEIILWPLQISYFIVFVQKWLDIWALYLDYSELTPDYYSMTLGKLINCSALGLLLYWTYYFNIYVFLILHDRIHISSEQL